MPPYGVLQVLPLVDPIELGDAFPLIMEMVTSRNNNNAFTEYYLSVSQEWNGTLRSHPQLWKHLILPPALLHSRKQGQLFLERRLLLSRDADLEVNPFYHAPDHFTRKYPSRHKREMVVRQALRIEQKWDNSHRVRSLVLGPGEIMKSIPVPLPQLKHLVFFDLDLSILFGKDEAGSNIAATFYPELESFHWVPRYHCDIGRVPLSILRQLSSLSIDCISEEQLSGLATFIPNVVHLGIRTVLTQSLDLENPLVETFDFAAVGDNTKGKIDVQLNMPRLRSLVVRAKGLCNLSLEADSGTNIHTFVWEKGDLLDLDLLSSLPSLRKLNVWGWTPTCRELELLERRLEDNPHLCPRLRWVNGNALEKFLSLRCSDKPWNAMVQRTLRRAQKVGRWTKYLPWLIVLSPLLFVFGFFFFMLLAFATITVRLVRCFL